MGENVVVTAKVNVTVPRSLWLVVKFGESAATFTALSDEDIWTYDLEPDECFVRYELVQGESTKTLADKP